MDETKQSKVDKTLSLKERFAFLKHCAQKYEIEGTSPVSDKEYDEEYYDLQAIDPDNSFFDEVGCISAEVIQGQTVKHKRKMGSLNKSRNPEEFKTWLMSRYEKNYTGIYVLQYKIDGLSLALHYSNGKLVQALTRGTGDEGFDVTEKAKTVKGVRHTIPDKRDIEVRGECYKNKFDFYKKWHKSVGGEFMNPRNFAAGKMNEKDPEETKKAELEFIAYEEAALDWDTEIEKNAWLEEQGFETLNSSTKRTKQGNSLSKVVDAVIWYMDHIERNKLPFGIDGIVVKLNDIKLAKSMGYDSRGRKPNANRAVKFPPLTADTVLIGVEVNVGRTGKLTPVGLLTPVELDGAMIGRVSLHNFGALVGKNSIKLGAKVEIAKKGDIIPQIVKVKVNGDKSIPVPNVCPSCGEKVEWTYNPLKEPVDLVCDNPDCVAQLNRKIEKWFDVISVKGFGKGTIAKLTDKEEMEWEGRAIVESLEEMYYMLDNDRQSKHPFQKYAYLQKKLGETTYKNLLESIKSVKEVTLPAFIEATGISRIGSSSKDIADLAPTIQDVDKLTVDDLLKIENFGQVKANSFIKEWKARRKEIEVLLNYVAIKMAVKSSDKLAGKKFCFTGSFSIDRKELQKMVIDNGGSASSSVGKGVILCWDGSEMGNKYNKAIKDGNHIISEDEFMKMIE